MALKFVFAAIIIGGLFLIFFALLVHWLKVREARKGVELAQERAWNRAQLEEYYDDDLPDYIDRELEKSSVELNDGLDDRL